MRERCVVGFSAVLLLVAFICARPVHAAESLTALFTPPLLMRSPAEEMTSQGADNAAKDERPSLGAPFATTDEEVGARVWQAHQGYMDRFGLNVAEPDPRLQVPVHFFADGGFLMVHSYIANNPAFLINGPHLKTIPNSNFNYQVNFAPRVTLGGMTNSGWGIRGTWWQLDESSQSYTFPSKDSTLHTTISSVPVFGIPGFTSPGPVAKQTKIFADQIHFDNHLHLTVADLEGFRELNWERWSLLLGTGVRWLYLSQDYDGFRLNKGKTTQGKTKLNLVSDYDYFMSGRSFSGPGLTDFLEVRRRFGPGFFWYGSVRGSILFGDNGTSSFQRNGEDLVTTPPKGKAHTIVLNTDTQKSMTGSSTLDMGDFETGMDVHFRWGRSILFLRAGVADQTLFGAGSATHDHGNISFFGLRFSAGVNY